MKYVCGTILCCLFGFTALTEIAACIKWSNSQCQCVVWVCALLDAANIFCICLLQGNYADSVFVFMPLVWHSIQNSSYGRNGLENYLRNKCSGCVVALFPFSSLNIFCSLYYGSEVPRILMRMYWSGFYEFPKWCFVLRIEHLCDWKSVLPLQKVYSCEHLTPVGICFPVPWICVELESCSVLKHQHVLNPVNCLSV